MIPFVLVSVFLFCLILRCFLHRETLRLDVSGLDWKFFICFAIQHRRISWEQLVSIQKGYSNAENSGKIKLIRGWGIAVETESKTFSIFLDMNYHIEGRALQEQLRNFIDDYCNRNNIPLPNYVRKKIIAKKKERSNLLLHQNQDFFEIQSVPLAVWNVDRIATSFFFIGWTMMSVIFPAILFYDLVSNHGKNLIADFLGFCFFIPFLSVWLLLAFSFFGRHNRWEILRISSEGVYYKRCIWTPFFVYLPLWRYRLSLNKIGLAERFVVNNDSGIEIPTSGKPLRCFWYQQGDGNPGSLIKPLNERLSQLGVRKIERPKTEFVPVIGRWRLHREDTMISLTMRGKVSWSLFGGGLFVFFFCGSIISILAIGFFLACFSPAVSFLGYFGTLFLILFDLFAIFMLFRTMMMFLHCCCRYTIIIDIHGVQYQRSWLGVSRSVFVPSERIGKVDAVRYETKPLFAIRLDELLNVMNIETLEQEEQQADTFNVRITDADSQEKTLVRIPALFQKEARWIAEAIRQRAAI